MDDVNQGPADDDVAVARAETAADNLSTRVTALIDDRVGLSRSARDWAAAVAIELVETVLGPRQALLPLAAEGSVEVLNRGLYRMSYEAALACEHARQVGSGGWAPVMAAEFAADSADPGDVTSVVEQRLRAALDPSGGEPEVREPATVGQLARLLCLCVIDAHEARDRYDYSAMAVALGACDHWLPAGCTLHSFRVLECLRAVAQAGRSRDDGGTPPSRRDLYDLSRLVAEDRDDRGADHHADHALLLLVTAIGHMQRRYLVQDVFRCRENDRVSLVDWALDLLEDLEQRGVAKAQGWPLPGGPNPVAHHVYYYRHFIHHIKAMYLAEQLLKEDAEGGSEDVEKVDEIDISSLRTEYQMASASLERALSLVPASNEARWRYYDLNSENLELEESLRLELLEQRLDTRRTVKRLAKANVERFAEDAKDKVNEGLASVSMRIVEIIGVFLAVVAILGSTVASATIGGLSFTDRIIILAVGGTMPLAYFVLLRWIVHGRLSIRRARGSESSQ